MPWFVEGARVAWRARDGVCTGTVTTPRGDHSWVHPDDAAAGFTVLVGNYDLKKLPPELDPRS